MRHRRAGFTLIELLVVIAIIAILAAILFPIFGAAKEAGKKASCIANMKQIGYALAMYREDYSGWNPGIWANYSQSYQFNDKAAFWNVMFGYMKARLGKDAKNIVKCPSAPWLKQEWNDQATAYTRTGFAYMLNETGWTGGNHSFCLAWAIHDSKIKRPSYLVHVGECMGWSGFGVAYQGTNQDNENPTSATGWAGPWPRSNEDIPFNGDRVGQYGGTICKIYNLRVSHKGSTNLLIYDGHVKNCKGTTGRYWGNYY